ncbi:Lrp/AsnC family transcriptional regulator [Pseudomonas syringae]|uniref:Lrp/AsnC family transcriptional regulator n=1 Tax=Pseudomonas ovata TaxID=1839709 RepID=UPI000D697E7A|nr:Lrp/AsnC family transcriptional regulator [Pseudomonas ovata]MBD8491409.1 Lrp/AsnC family transcriptional regulator [Pseudomonas syringae]MBD8574568.1 Lrp/AsnC family transcriptional regulator [Pseudomonas syringae]MBD8789131.1 Lrp/AsnC family transcriptional regulator [Pseudomonas syringae]MBD8800425.1 Lrp/AsnC family transcriptional regulator [Pseudomonas syringae]MBD8814796.1 Lrp/AsnC family transcriptional regulator [Pseudomonas syringae]
MKLDSIDLRILACLNQDGRMSNQDLAEKVSLSPSACLRRLRNLESDGVIAGYGVRLDPARLGIEVHAMVNVNVRQDMEGWHERFIEAVQRWPEVADAYIVTGASNYLLRVRARNLSHYTDFIVNQLHATPGVTDIRSDIILQSLKSRDNLLDLVRPAT